jgi:DnaJ homolog subfamily C member 13
MFGWGSSATTSGGPQTLSAIAVREQLFLSTKVHAIRGKYGRLWCLTTKEVHHIDPADFKVTNSWPWADVVELVPSSGSTTDFTFTVKTNKKSEVLKFMCDDRSALLTSVARYASEAAAAGASAAGSAAARRFVAVKITRASMRMECAVELLPWGVAYSINDRRLGVYPFTEITSIKPIKDDPSAVVIYVHGRGRLFAMPERSEFLRLSSNQLTRLGAPSVVSDQGITTADYRTERQNHGSEMGSPRVAEFDVLKISSKNSTPRTRKLVLTEKSITERDATSYAVVSSRSHSSIFGLVRHWDEPQRLTIEYKDGSARSYLSSLRESVLGALLDSCRNCGNTAVIVSPEPTKAGERCLPFSLDEDPAVELAYLSELQRRTRAVAGAAASAGPYNQGLIKASSEFNQNISGAGISYAAKKSTIQAILPDLLATLNQVVQMEDGPTAFVVTLLQAIMRVVSSKAGYQLFPTLSDAGVALLACMRHTDDGVCASAFDLLRRLLYNPRREGTDEDSEAQIKKLILTTDIRVAMIQALDTHTTLGTGNVSAGNEGTVAVMSITACLDSVLVSNVDTTAPEAGDHLLQLVASRYPSLLSLFRCRCSGVVESCALLMRAIVEQADLGTCRAMQAASLSSGVWLRHFFNACFASSQDQKFVSRYLLELWSQGNATSLDVLRHVLPAGLLLFLDMPKMSGTESSHLENVEAGNAPASAASAAAAKAQGLAHRLRSRLEQYTRATHNRVRRRLTALDVGAAGAKKGYFGRVDPDLQANIAAAANAAVLAAKEVTKAKIEELGKEDNFAMLFFQMTQDHSIPDLIWNQQTRGELRSALEAELREIEREIELGGSQNGAKILNAAASQPTPPSPGTTTPTNEAARSRTESTASTGAAQAAPAAAPVGGGVAAGGATVTGGVDMALRVAWNYSEFEVEYPSLVQELRVGDYYLRLFLEAGEQSVVNLREPGRFFDALYRRVLRENASNLKCVCLRGMSRVYERHWKTIGVFEDTDYVVYLLSQSQHAEVRDRLLLLLLSLSNHPLNCEKMINPECLELLVDLLTTAHTQENEQRAMPTLKAGAANGLLLTDASASSSLRQKSEDDPVEGEEGGEAKAAVASNPKESVKIWHYRAKKQDLQPGEKPEKGPYSLQDMQRLGDMKKLFPDSLVWAQGMREWVRLDSMRAILWYCVSEGTAALLPVQRGEASCDLLRRLATLRPAVDAEGAPVRPVPKAKRVLCGPRTLPHIVQALLAGSPKLIDLVSSLVSELVRHNPKAMIKLYTTGIFYFILGYSGSNFLGLSQLLKTTHLQQSFHSDAASLASETSVARRSILGTMLPESLICVLENRGAQAFADTFLSNVDNPEVIWKYSMRGHLIDMVAQHLGDMPARLSANPCTLYENVPIPPVKFEELTEEVWCSNFYLANLCDESRFNDWEIPDPVNLLRAVLDGWRLELAKTGEKGISMEEAFTTMGLPNAADEKEVRKAYRKLALKFHPDKNPAGREVFEKIQKAYDAITSASRPGQQGSGAGGPDPVTILLMVKTQCILFKRYSAVLKQYKYAGYPLVLEGLSLRSEEIVAGERASQLEVCSRLVYLTCLATPRNAEELVRIGGAECLMALLARVVPVCCGVNPPLSADSKEMMVLDNVLHTLSGLATMKEARDRMSANAAFPALLVTCLTVPHAARIMQHSLDCISRLAKESKLQDALVNVGVIYRLLPLLFRFDATFEASENKDVPIAGSSTPTNSAKPGAKPETFANAGTPGSNTHTDNEQRAANQQAKLSVRALARLGGYIEGDLATPYNSRVRRSLASLLTPPLAKRLSRPAAEPLLRTLNSHEEGPAVVWIAAMRKELLAFLGKALDTLNKTGVADMTVAQEFIHPYLKEELRLSGIFIRYYVQDPSLQLDDPCGTVLALMQHIAFSKAGGAQPIPASYTEAAIKASDEEGAPYPFESISSDIAKKHLRLALRALHLVLVNNTGSEAGVAKEGAPYLAPLFALIEREDANSAESDNMASSGENVHAASTSQNRGAAGSGASAGAGGARSTPAPPTASLRELVLCSIAAFVHNEPCANVVSGRFLLPTLIRNLARDSGAFGPILRTLFTHSKVVAEAARIGALIDLALVFVGGPATGPPPRLGTGRPVRESSDVPKAARASAGALLSTMASDSNLGPTVLINLTQLMPDALAIAVKESVSGATSAGAGSSGILATGSGVGAAGAGGGSGSQGDVVTIFDTDHETPELLWNAVCRHELRAALGEMQNGLKGLRSRAAAAGAPGGADGCAWSMPPTFRVRFGTAEGELKVGGVYVRLFLKEPTFPLRDPKVFLEALLRRFCQEGDHLCGMTSEDAEKVRAAQNAAAEAARAEEAAGGVGMRTRKDVDTSNETNMLVVRGEDVLTQITHAVVCLLRVRLALADQAAMLGYVPRIVGLLTNSIGKNSRYNLQVQSFRVLQVLAPNKACVAALGKANVAGSMMRILKATPIPRDAAFFMECLKQILETDTQDFHVVVEACIREGAIELLIRVLEKEKLDHLVDPSAAKVHGVNILKVLENDTVHGPAAQAQLSAAHAESWDKYKYQKHDLFLSKNDTRDYFLTDVATAQPAFMLKNSAEWGSGGESSAPSSTTSYAENSRAPPSYNEYATSSSSSTPLPVNPFNAGSPVASNAAPMSPAPYTPPVNPFTGVASPAPAPAPLGADPFADLLG